MVPAIFVGKRWFSFDVRFFAHHRRLPGGLSKRCYGPLSTLLRMGLFSRFLVQALSGLPARA
jgi:hypothetical protein